MAGSTAAGQVHVPALPQMQAAALCPAKHSETSDVQGMLMKKGGTGVSHPNIALVKYWGKKDAESNTALNASISITVDKLTTTTRVYESSADEMFINGVKTQMSSRHAAVLSAFRQKAGYSGCLRVVSENSFPHSCGLASSASGFAALVLALDDFFSLCLCKAELSEFARIGSGSASRSIFSGIAIYEGRRARKLCDWEELRVFVVVVESNAKSVGSTLGMTRTARTSSLFQERLRNIGRKVERAVGYVQERNFEALALLAMRESNEMHAVCLDSWPPIMYLNDESFRVIDLCLKYNEDGVRVAYTFDAGPNAFILTLDSSLLIQRCLNKGDGSSVSKDKIVKILPPIEGSARADSARPFPFGHPAWI
ncbi:UNVERIFIED_CONTAM: hypothetical protein PYX00_011388 [Menopon gallinae]|uniref:Diphosphomevalonate decarboxylase n=1 Tax=Menopon gallinae TaxID=328185 RepID=A0AAW2H7B6_9NEOP